MSENRQTSESARISDKIREFIVDHFPQARRDRPDDDQDLLHSGIVDSLGILELVTYLAEEFNILVSDEELLPDNFSSIRRLTDFVERKGSGTTEW